MLSSALQGSFGISIGWQTKNLSTASPLTVCFATSNWSLYQNVVALEATMQGNFSDMKHRADRDWRQSSFWHWETDFSPTRPPKWIRMRAIAIFVQDKWLAEESHKQRLGSNLVELCLTRQVCDSRGINA